MPLYHAVLGYSVVWCWYSWWLSISKRHTEKPAKYCIFLPYAKSHCWQCFPKQHPRRLSREENGASASRCWCDCKVASIEKYRKRPVRGKKKQKNSPKSSNLCVALYICLSFWSCFSIFLLASLCAFSSFLWSSVLLLPKQPIFPQERRKRGSRVGGDGGISGVGGGCVGRKINTLC